jgi:hypothetical protein
MAAALLLVCMALVESVTALQSSPWRIAIDETDKNGTDKKRVLFLGCSVDRFILEDACSAIGGSEALDTVITEAPSKINEPRSCSSKDLDLAYMFIPGTNRAPYFSGFMQRACPHCQSAETEQMVSVDAPAFASRVFEGHPDLVVVDSSLWALSAFWENGFTENETGGLSNLSQVSTARLQEWCDNDVNELLGWVQSAFPSSRIAFRTGPTVALNFSMYGQTGDSLDFMHHCIRGKIDGRDMLFGEYTMIDFHGMVDKLIDVDGYCGKSASDCGAESVFRDSRHTGTMANLKYMNAVLYHVNHPPIPIPTKRSLTELARSEVVADSEDGI